MKRRRLQQGKGPLELVEEAVHLLRLAPASLLLVYYTGTLPFILGLLYFWSDMSRSSFAGQRLPAAALGMVLLFVWMKTWQTAFTHQMQARLCGDSPPRWCGRRFLRAALVQTILQPSGLILLPIALVILLPFGWVYSFYQNATVLGTGETTDIRTIVRKALRLAALWPGQNHYALLTLKLFGLFVFLNLLTGVLAVPFLLKTLLGLETMFSRSWVAALNPTFFAVIACLTHLCMDPLVKTFCVLRCFYGESLQTGQDLKTELRGLASASPLALACLALGLLTAPLSAQTRPVPNAERDVPNAELETQNPAPANKNPEPETGNPKLETGLPAAGLDRAIHDVINQREYNWRLPREKRVEEDEPGWFANLVDSVVGTVRDGLRQVQEWLRKILRWIFGDQAREPSSVGLGWLTQLHWLLVALLAALVAALVVMLFRIWQRRRRSEEVAAQPIQAVPDVADENVGAEQLPEDGWMTLARELLERGELRLALRAFYLSTLAHLAERNLISLARFKSNRDYERELDRRSHALPDLSRTFAENVSLFDRVWYGLHEVTREMIERFAANVERIKEK